MSGLARFTRADFPNFRVSLRRVEQDKAAVQAGLTLAINNGQVEGQVTKIKLIKRMMYGRATFPLLRKPRPARSLGRAELPEAGCAKETAVHREQLQGNPVAAHRYRPSLDLDEIFQLPCLGLDDLARAEIVLVAGQQDAFQSEGFRLL